MPAICTLALLMVGLGYLGFEDGDVQTRLYRSLQLFALEGGESVANVNTELQIARFGAPIIAGIAALTALAALFRDQIRLYRVRLFARNHVVVAGLGEAAFKLASSFRRSGACVVVVESDGSNSFIDGCHQRGMTVVVGDVTDPTTLRRARLETASQLIAITGDDGTNLAVMTAADALWPEGRKRLLSILVQLDDLALWRRLQAAVLAARNGFHFRIEFFNILDSAARRLLDRHAPFAPSAPGVTRRPHIVFVGLAGVGQFALPRAAARWMSDRQPGEHLLVTVVGSAAEKEQREIVERYPDIVQMCDLEAIAQATESAAFHSGELVSMLVAQAPVTSVYICLSDEAEALSAALALTARLPDNVTIVVTVADEAAGAGRLLEDGGNHFRGVTTFGVLSGTLTPDLLLTSTNEALAQARHEVYLRQESEHASTASDRPALVPWHELPDRLKESNRQFADSIRLKLATKGRGLVPAPLSGSNGAAQTFSEVEVEELAVLEHERWHDELASRRFVAGKRDDARRQHPSLVPWGELTEEDRERDRSSIRALPEMLARAGFEIYRLD